MQFLYKTQTRYLFHSHIRIKIPDHYPDTLFDEFYHILETVDRRYNSYREDSYTDRINRNAGQFVDVDEELINILNQVIKLSDWFDGKYDITIMPLLRLWGFYKNEIHRIPTDKEINTVKRLVDYRLIEIRGNQVRIAPGQEIITGSFLKSYAVNKLIRKMRDMGITDALVNAGGSTIVGINNHIHPYWKINVRMPQSGELLDALRLSNQCLCTSSQSATFVDINGKQYGHIINASTGYPCENKQTGIICNDCMTADILSTALFNETSSGFLMKMKQLSTIYNISGYMIDSNSDIYTYNLPEIVKLSILNPLISKIS